MYDDEEEGEAHDCAEARRISKAPCEGCEEEEE
jgi:hypothetical protein